MGMLGAYGGSPGSKKVRDQTKKWLDSGGGAGVGGDGPPNSPGPPVRPTSPPDTPEGSLRSRGPSIARSASSPVWEPCSREAVVEEAEMSFRRR